MAMPKYLLKIESVISLISSSTKILYVESDHPDVLSLILNQDTGSPTLRDWLGIKQ